MDSVLTGLSTGHPVRSLRNKLTRKLLQIEKNGASFEEIEKLTLGSLRRAVVEGDIAEGSVMAGQIAGMIKDIKPVKEIITDLIEEANNVLASLHGGVTA